jgi:hypothetical protein
MAERGVYKIIEIVGTRISENYLQMACTIVIDPGTCNSSISNRG